MTKPYSANVKIEDIPRDIWESIERIATHLQQPKKVIVKMALIEFAQRHDHEVPLTEQQVEPGISGSVGGRYIPKTSQTETTNG